MINKKIKLNRGPSAQAGMTYVELIVVLSIFAVLSTVAVFNYGSFEAKIDLKNSASDVALQIVQAQRSSLSGSIPTQTPIVSPWKPSYGVYFSIASNKGADNKNFIYFTDLNQNNLFDDSSCIGECISKNPITKNNNIDTKVNNGISVFYTNGPPTSLDDLTITFTRPDADATFKSTTAFSGATPSFVQIKVVSPKANSSLIRVYTSGRVEID